MKTFKIINKFLVILAFSLGISACREGKIVPRTYEETVVESPLEKMTAKMDASSLPPGHPDISQMSQMASSTSSIDFKWIAPQGWTEKPGGGMRLVTFTANDSSPIECSIVSLGGMAGGLEANIRRWMGQINMPEIPEDQFNAFLQKQEEIKSEGGLTINLVDLTALQNKEPQEAPSMIAGILTIEDKTVFVKMTGTKKAVQEEKEHFRQLCQSLQLIHE